MPTVTVRHENSRLMRIRRLLGVSDDRVDLELDAVIMDEMSQPTVSLSRIRTELSLNHGWKFKPGPREKYRPSRLAEASAYAKMEKRIEDLAKLLYGLFPAITEPSERSELWAQEPEEMQRSYRNAALAIARHIIDTGGL